MFCQVYDSQDEDTTYERVQQLPYLDLVLKEGMRMFPVAPFIVRTGNFRIIFFQLFISTNKIHFRYCYCSNGGHSSQQLYNSAPLNHYDVDLQSTLQKRRLG